MKYFEKYPDKLSLFDPENPPEYLNLSHSSKIKIKFICNHCNSIYSSSPNDNTNCPYCRGLKVNHTNSLSSRFPEIAKHVLSPDPNIISYSSGKLCNVLCPKCNSSFIQPVNNLIKYFKNNNTGCPYCKGFKTNHTNNLTNYPDLIQYWDYNKNQSPTLFTKGSSKSVYIICQHCNSSNLTRVYNIKKKSCPHCSKRISKSENQWLDSLNIPKENRQIKQLINNKYYIFDALYNNTVYEFYGNYWHGNLTIYNPDQINKSTNTTFKELYDKTIERENIIKSVYNFVSIWESDWNQLK